MNSILAACLFTTCLTVTAVAQTSGPGLTWEGTLGGSAGSFVPTCISLPVVALQGENVTLRTWGDPNALFLLGASLSTMPCLPIPGIGNGLLLGAPVFLVAAGTLTQLTPCLSCPQGFEPFSFTVPTLLPVGTALSFQALSFGNNIPSLTVAITATVQ